ncbi:MAG: ABC transporter ATP-binding protein [Ignavibacteria bacterium]|nr:ABC transporter ATP-binding protein [Ignavibacteria bacterium]
MNNKLLEVKNLSTYFFVEPGDEGKYHADSDAEKFTEGIGKYGRKLKGKIPAKAVDNVSFDIYEGEIVGMVGESGSGKSVTAYSILRLIQEPVGKIVSGNIIFKGNDLMKLPEDEIRKYRGKEISMIFQEPMTALNPVMKIGKQITEVLFEHEKISKTDALERTLDMLKLTGLPEPERRIFEYPHQLSGGMCQRVIIAMALICNPPLIIADEPTTALDVTIQAQILELIKNIMSERNHTSMLLITHNLGIVSDLCKRVIVMYGGTIQEIAGVPDIFNVPKHPYTVALLESVPAAGEKTEGKLKTIPGVVPGLLEMPSGCKFCSRCTKVMDICREIEPDLKQLSENCFVRCHLY